ncbi:hypothetical protein ACIQUB_03455 [Rhizobium sp. NPDC090275]|uniref:hypothetical protein n=1 Tax=Rhizobium sp. NPDC090275 TaxID=3364498 RepID=UPI000DDEF620
MANDCRPLVEVSIQRNGLLIPLGIMTIAQAHDLPRRQDLVFVQLVEKADGRAFPQFEQPSRRI